MLKAEITASSYCVPLSMEQFDKLHPRDVDDEIAFDEELEKLGAERIEYNGHFGANIFFTVEEGTPIQPILDRIELELENTE
jgi:hypothetical protein